MCLVQWTGVRPRLFSYEESRFSHDAAQNYIVLLQEGLILI